MSIVCEEVFDENSQPSIEEIRDYATKIGIDPDSEPQLLPLAIKGLMEALPQGWRPCYDDKSRSYYYHNNATGKTQWEHPLDDIYRGLVKKVRAESYSASLGGEHTEDASLARDDLLSYEEPPLFMCDNAPEATKDDGNVVCQKILSRHNSEVVSLLIGSGSADKAGLEHKNDSNFNKHPRNLETGELKVVGGGTMFLKSNTATTVRKMPETPEFVDTQNPSKGILSSKNSFSDELKNIKGPAEDRPSNNKRSKEVDDKKSVRFCIESDDDECVDEKNDSADDERLPVQDIYLKPTLGDCSLHQVKQTEETDENSSNAKNNLKLIKPNPTDFIQPILMISDDSDTEDDSFPRNRKASKYLDKLTENDRAFIHEDVSLKSKKFEEKASKKLCQLKQRIWEEKNDELVTFQNDLEDSHRHELERILITAKTEHENQIKSELEDVKIEMETRNTAVIKEEQSKYDLSLGELRDEFKQRLEKDRQLLSEQYEREKKDLEQLYEKKMDNLRKEWAERVDDMIKTHNSNVEQLKQNHAIVLEELKRGFKAEEDSIRNDHKAIVMDLKNKMASESNRGAQSKDSPVNERDLERVKCEKKLLEDKYRCLKQKYVQLKTEVKSSIDRRSKRKEQGNIGVGGGGGGGGGTTASTTGSETERSFANSKERAKPILRTARQIQVQDLDATSMSDKSESKSNKNEYESSDTSNNLSRSNKKKNFVPLKNSTVIRNNNAAKSKTHKYQRPCSPVENLRRQLQKLEDLEDQFPQNTETYHLRYPFSSEEKPKFEGSSSELEFFRHRIHLERDSIKRAKESLKSEKLHFQQRQKDLKFKHGSMTRQTLRQLCQEEKELTDMEVSLHRTKSLLGEKVIRLRHLEQSLYRATVTSAKNKNDDATTLSDISSHSASSGISSSEFATAAEGGVGGSMSRRGVFQAEEHFQESSEIIQSLESLNLEIREIWDVLRKQHQNSVLQPLVYTDLSSWPATTTAALLPNNGSGSGATILNGGSSALLATAGGVPPSIPTLADRLHNYRQQQQQQMALLAGQNTMVTATAHYGNQRGGVATGTASTTTTLVERTKSLRHWLKQAGVNSNNNDNNNGSEDNADNSCYYGDTAEDIVITKGNKISSSPQQSSL